MMENDITSESDINPRAAALGMRRSGLAPAKQVGLNDLFVLPTQNYIPKKRQLSPEDMANFRADKAKAERQLAGTIGGAIASYFTGVPGLSRVGRYAVPKIDAEHERFIRRYGNEDTQNQNLFFTSPGAFMTSPNVSDSDKAMTAIGGGNTPNQIDAKLRTIKATVTDPQQALQDSLNTIKNNFMNPISVLNPSSPIPSGGSNKIVCTAMNEYYGFGVFRQTIWLKHSATLDPAYQKGYHKLFLPLVKLGYKKQIPIISKLTRNILEHIARHRTIDIRAEMCHNKRDPLGKLYRFVLEPLCYYVGKGIK